jgi:hypothetical protein
MRHNYLDKAQSSEHVSFNHDALCIMSWFGFGTAE